MATLTDKSPMPYGKHKGKQLANVPADYLLWLYKNNKCNAQVKAYVIDNLEVINEQTKRIRQEQERRFM